VPLLQNLFRFSFLHPIDLAICLAAGVLSTLWFEVLKLWPRKRQRRIG
jgi:Ca2+-transporting ATPase